MGSWNCFLITHTSVVFMALAAQKRRAVLGVPHQSDLDKISPPFTDLCNKGS